MHSIEQPARSCGKWIFSSRQASVLNEYGFRDTGNRKTFWRGPSRIRITAQRYIYESIGEKCRHFRSFQGLMDFLHTKTGA